MGKQAKEQFKTIIDWEKLMRFNARGCPARGRKFKLGEPVVRACGAWDDEPLSLKYVHENEALYDPGAAMYIDRRQVHASKPNVQMKTRTNL